MRSIQIELECFRGPLELLVSLVQTEELAIQEITIQKILQQLEIAFKEIFLLEQSAEALYYLSHLLLLKSRSFFIKEQVEDNITFDFSLSLFEQIAEYSQFKKIAQGLKAQEISTHLEYPRQLEKPLLKKPLGLELISLENLMLLFNQVIKKIPLSQNFPKALILEEPWSVKDKIAIIKNILEKSPQILFTTLFEQIGAKKELIILFLALLELIKKGEVGIAKDKESDKIILFTYETKSF